MKDTLSKFFLARRAASQGPCQLGCKLRFGGQGGGELGSGAGAPGASTVELCSELWSVETRTRQASTNAHVRRRTTWDTRGAHGGR